MCNTPRGRSRGKQVNISNLLIVRRSDVESDFGLSPQVRAASQASGRRPADRTAAEVAAEADQDAIRQAQRADDEDDEDEPSSQDFVAPIMEILENRLRVRLLRAARDATTLSNHAAATAATAAPAPSAPGPTVPGPSAPGPTAPSSGPSTYLRSGRDRRFRIDSSNEDTD